MCSICGSETRHARINIYIHLRDVHKLTVDEYAAQYGTPAPLPGVSPSPGGYSGPASPASDPLRTVPVTSPTVFSSKWNKCRSVRY